MEYLFLLSAVYNFLAAGILWAKASQIITESGEIQKDGTQFRMFTGGTAAIFGILDTYLFLSAGIQDSLYSLVMLSVLVKLWSFSMITLNLKLNRQPVEDFIPMGLVNGIFMVLFIGFLA